VIAVCGECHYPLIESTSRPGSLICPAPWGECTHSGQVAA
jgi:hypothetical protein